MLFGDVGNEGNGWDYTLAHLQRVVEDALAHASGAVADAAGAAVPAPAQEPTAGPGTLREGFLALMDILGRRTAELHAALAFESGDAAFDPEPFTAEDARTLRTRLTESLDGALDALSARRDALPAVLAPMATRVLAAREALRERAASLVPDDIGAARTRYHGDYHLAQVLLTRHDFAIVGFEGDPARPLAARRAKHCPLRDVASMLRSFGYAANYAAWHGPAHTDADRERIAGPLEEWRKDATAAFLGGYRVRMAGVPSMPPADVEAALLDAFIVEGALHELRFELRHRPDWVGVPLRAITRILLTPPAGASA